MPDKLQVTVRSSRVALRWTLLTAVAWALFIPVLGWIEEVDIFLVGQSEPLNPLSRMLTYLLVALPIGVLQMVALRPCIRRAYRWAAATLAGTALGVLAGILGGSKLWLSDLAWIALPVALLQGLVLRPVLGRAWLWWLAKPLLLVPSFLLGSYMGFAAVALVVVPFEWFADAYPMLKPVVDALGLVALVLPVGILFGLATGVLLEVLLSRQARRERTISPLPDLPTAGSVH